MICRRLIVVAAVVLTVSPAVAQTDPANLRGESVQTRKRLAEAQQKLATNPELASAELQRILDEAGDDLIPIDIPDPHQQHRQYRPARWIAQQLLSALPAVPLDTYRARIAEPARKLLEQGRRERNLEPLWVLQDRFALSPAARDGSIILGDLLFERGQYRTAEVVWRRLLPRGPEQPLGRLLTENSGLLPSEPVADPAAIHARVVLAVIFQHEFVRAREEAVRFAVLYPAARGRLGGRSGLYTDLLSAWLNAPPRTVPRAPLGNALGWPTFAGSPTRSGRVECRMPRFWQERPTWRQPLAADRANDGGLSLHRPPFGHPVIANGFVAISDGVTLRSFELKTGSPSGKSFPANSIGAGRSSLSSDGQRLFAQLGSGPRECFLACSIASRSPIPFERPFREQWRIVPPLCDGNSDSVWAGPPLVAANRMWAVTVRNEGGRSIHAIAAYDPVETDRAPDGPAWVVDICDSPLSGSTRPHRELLTLAGRHVVYNSNAGAVVALDASTGRRAWAYRYPSRARRASDSEDVERSPPAVAVGGRVFVAPTDDDRVHALDEETGQPLWESDPAFGGQILGVTQQRVIVSTRGPLRGIRGLSVVSGSHLPLDGGWFQHDGGGILSYGLGFVSDESVVWPTRAGLYFLDPTTGRPQARLRNHLPPPRDGLFGNLAYSEGVLVVVTASELWGYVGEERPIPPTNADPDRKAFDALIAAADEHLERGEHEEARERFAEVVRSALPNRYRAWAGARLLQHVPANAAVPRRILESFGPELESEWLISADGKLLTFGESLATHRGSIPTPASPFERGVLNDGPSTGTHHTLSERTSVVRTVALPAAACPLHQLRTLHGQEAHLFAVAGNDLLAVSTKDGATRTYRCSGPLTHAGDYREGCVAVGPEHIAVYGREREPTWVFRVPLLDPLPQLNAHRTVRVGPPSALPLLSSFALAGSWLVARLGDHHLIALDLSARRVGWVLGADGRIGYVSNRFPEAPRFEPHFFLGNGAFIVQLSDGRRWRVRASNGAILDDRGHELQRAAAEDSGTATARAPWSGPPVEIEPGRIAVADAPGLFSIVDLETGVTTAGATTDGESSLNGISPQFRIWIDRGIVVWHRNHGVELERYDGIRNSGRWRGGPHFLNAARVELADADADGDRAYIPFENRVRAIAWHNGLPLWTTDLSDAGADGRWIVRRGANTLLVYPESPVAVRPLPNGTAMAIDGFPLRPPVWQLPALTVGAYDAWVERTLPVLLLNPESGAVMKRFTLPARGPIQTASVRHDSVAFALGDRVVWLR